MALLPRRPAADLTLWKRPAGIRRVGDLACQLPQLRVRRARMAEQVIGQHRIRELEESGEPPALLRVSPALLGRSHSLLRASKKEPRPCIAFEQHIQLFHASATTPEKVPGMQIPRLAGRREAAVRGRRLDLGQVCRSTSIFFISAMALAGLRSFGQTSVQFMIVWQR